ncbi:RHS repeat protein [Cronobacter sakazakii]|uniref:RHS repeat domain-containing protein n=1 Tax=Cronobacter sakazakii TaxID=28141 RepID=UPI000CFDA760|nr:RHS repeat domain-containing protein [Cronobacter sakazakii]ELY2631515.1 RHS repeat protein [Cronobacter sakazakii]ELY2639609.1 RHS repeat protein [Cronobacter sakazakii]ELY2660165.1 RHS repeat protein [Cronobacter sakazakii]ELY4640123.1 RHS repeat protein [Cronobacter sakazakii]ELY4786044.1 RHS repeat protein [Cronobacter sakazakii]
MIHRAVFRHKINNNQSLKYFAESSRWVYGYDEHGNLTEVHDPLGNSTFTTWHPVFAFPVKEVLPDSATW